VADEDSPAVAADSEAEEATTTDTQLEPITAPPSNRILGHVVYRLHTTLTPPPAPPALPPLPVARVRAAVVGKAFSGSSAAIVAACDKLGISVVSPITLIEDAMKAANTRETEAQFLEAHGVSQPEVAPEPLVDAYPELTRTHPSTVSLFASPLPVPPATKVQLLSQRALIGERLVTQVASGEVANAEDVIELVIQAIQQADSTKGWVIDGFPSTADEARLLEKRAVGCVSHPTLRHRTVERTHTHTHTHTRTLAGDLSSTGVIP
jgi:hypothetical protein